MDAAAATIGSVWSRREGRLIIGRLRAVDGAMAILAVVGMGPAVPVGASVLPPDDGGSPLLRLPVRQLLEGWKRMGSGP